MLLGQKTKLRPKRLKDAVNDYAWRVDPELSHLDAAVPLPLSFEEYLKGCAAELSLLGNQETRFAIETLDGKHIGNCAYFKIDKIKREAELGITIGDRNYWDKGYGTDAVITLLNHIFSKTNLNRVYLKTLDWNLRAQKCFKKCGFSPCGHLLKDGYNFVVMEIHRPRFPGDDERENDRRKDLRILLPAIFPYIRAFSFPGKP